MIDIISSNPYRILGVYANASMREIVANRGKMSVFLKVGKAISFPLDLDAELGPVNRTDETVTAADSKLTIESDKLKAAQFWFFNENTQFDVIASKYLSNGDLSGAMTIWQKKECMSSLQNLAISCLIKGQYKEATTYLSKLYANYTSEFLAAIDIKSGITETELVQGFVSSMMEAVPGIDISLLAHPECTDTWNAAVSPRVVEPIIRQLTDAVEKCRQTKGESREARLMAGQELDREGKDLLFKLRQLLSPQDIQFANISDKVANQVLQAGIDYYNAAGDPYAASETKKLLDAADMLAVGSVIKDRIKENRAIIDGILGSLPPAEVRQEADALKGALDRFNKLPRLMSHAETLLNEVEPILRQIKSKVGPANPYYLSISSVLVSSALNNLIADVNAKQKDYAANSSDKNRLKGYMAALNIASALTDRIEKLNMDGETRGRFNSNKNILSNLKAQLPKEEHKVGLIWQILFYAIMAFAIYKCSF